MKRNKENYSNYKLLSRCKRIVSLITFCTKNGIELINTRRVKEGLEFELSDKGYTIFRKLDTSEYDIQVIKVGGKVQFFGQVIYRIGLIVGMILCTVAMFIINNRLLQIHVYGLSNISEQEVIDELKTYGIGKFSYMDFNVDEIENKLSQKFGFSLVSIITKGNSLVVSIKESLPSIEDSYVPITSDYNMVIESIIVYSGTTNVKVGDIIYKGDILVHPYIKKGNDIVYLTPCADIIATVYYSNSYSFLTTQTTLERNSKRQMLDININLGKLKILNSSKNCKYENYELEESNNLISQYFLPIKIKKIYAYELQPVTIERDFDKEQETIINNLKDSVYDQVPDDMKVDKEEVNVTPIDGGYIVNVFLKSQVTLKYQYYS